MKVMREHVDAAVARQWRVSGASKLREQAALGLTADRCGFARSLEAWIRWTCARESSVRVQPVDPLLHRLS